MGSGAPDRAPGRHGSHWAAARWAAAGTRPLGGAGWGHTVSEGSRAALVGKLSLSLSLGHEVMNFDPGTQAIDVPSYNGLMMNDRNAAEFAHPMRIAVKQSLRDCRLFRLRQHHPSVHACVCVCVLEKTRFADGICRRY